jgi:gliding motility-associated-like protein
MKKPILMRNYSLPVFLSLFFFSSSLLGQSCESIGINFATWPDFGFGQANISPDTLYFAPPWYTYSRTDTLLPGTYTLTNNTTPWMSNDATTWIDIGDNNEFDSQEGYMMVVRTDTASVFWEQTVFLCDSADYQFTFDAINLFDPALTADTLPELEVFVNGLSVQNFGFLPQDSTWQTYTIGFNSAAGGEVTISIRNNTDGDLSNIFAIDNMVWERCGPIISLSETTPQTYCVGDPVEVQVDIPAFTSGAYQWELSRDGGFSWEEIGGPTDQNTVSIPSVPLDALVRVRAAESFDRLFDFTCALISEPIGFSFRPIEECFSSPITDIGVMCGAQSGGNLVPEGDFGSDTLQFGPPLPPGVTTYIYQDTTWPNDGFYSLINLWETDICEGAFSFPCWTLPLEDNSEDSLGYALFINATFGETGIFYRSTVSGLCENTTYQFSADILNLNNPAFGPNNMDDPEAIVILPNIDFIVGNVDDPLELLQVAPESYNSGDIINDSTWNTYGLTFKTGPGVTEVSFAIRNNAPGGLGNDLAIDNVSFSTCGTAELVNPPICEDESTTLSAITNPSEFPNPVIQWQESLDGGFSWNNLSGETSANLFIANPVLGRQYRYLLADSESKLTMPGCRIISQTGSVPIFFHTDTTINAAILPGESFQVANSSYDQPGTYVDSIQTVNGCDSVITTNLTRIMNPQVDSVVNICAGEIFQIGDTTFDQTGNYEVVLPATMGPDTIINIALTVFETDFTFIEEAICAGDSIQIGNFVIKEAGNFDILLTNQNGCDSTISLTLIENPVYDTIVNASICSNQSLNFGDTVLTSPGTYQQMFTTRRGCDSLVTLNLDVVDIIEVTLQESICEGESIQLGGETFDTPGSFQVVFPSVGGCDSIVNLELSVLNNDLTLLQENICEGASFQVGDTTITDPGSYQIVLPNSSGCDSIIQLDLIISPSFQEAINVALCEGESFQFGDSTINTPGNYQRTFSSVNGCDSTVTAEVMVFPTYDISLDTQLCEGDSFTFGSLTIDAEGVFTQSFQSQEGCDSLVTLNVTLSPVFMEETSIELCAGETFNGLVISNDTTITENLVTVNGCDSSIITNISVFPTYQIDESLSICRGDLFEGRPVFSDSLVIKNLQSVNGCDSLVRITISVDDLSDIEISGNTIICNEESVELIATPGFAAYQWSNGSTGSSILVNQAGIYEVTITSAAGCVDSVSVEVREQNLQPEIVVESPTCPGIADGFISVASVTGGLTPYLYALNGQPLQTAETFLALASGSYTLSIQDASGCTLDTLIQLEEPPAFNIDLGPDLEIQQGDSVQLNVQSDQPISSYSWSPEFGLSCTDCPNPLATPGASTIYEVNVIGENNCEASAQISITVSTQRNIYVPNVFSPNGDDQNDYFTIYSGQGVRRIHQFKVFDRWGKLVFSRDNQEPNAETLRWDGRTGTEENPQAVYVWFAEIEFFDGIREIFEGDVVLIR